MSVKIGDTAPDFTLSSQSGDMVSLHDLLGRKAVVLFFYPKDGTPGCTMESCAFRDSYEDFKDAGAEVVGISSDGVASHQEFAGRHNLPFLLLSDEGGKIRSLYGVSATRGVFPGRVTYLIGKDGVVRNIFSSQLDIQRHVDESLKILRDGG